MWKKLKDLFIAIRVAIMKHIPWNWLKIITWIWANKCMEYINELMIWKQVVTFDGGWDIEHSTSLMTLWSDNYLYKWCVICFLSVMVHPLSFIWSVDWYFIISVWTVSWLLCTPCNQTLLVCLTAAITQCLAVIETGFGHRLLGLSDKELWGHCCHQLPPQHTLATWRAIVC